ncbi:MAG: hypothetical protein IKM27_07715 [Clostridia bacterium]|nr:hypothetical protein [Clostridia bacterium]
MKEGLLIKVEERLQKRLSSSVSFSFTTAKVSANITEQIGKRFSAMKKEESLYDVIIRYVERINDIRFYFKNGAVNDAAFYRYACLDKSTWSDLKYGLIVPKKKTLLKLVIALRLNEEEAVDLMRRGSNSFDPKDMRDQIILSLIDLKCYEIEDVYEVLEEYRSKGNQKFENIYD